MRLTPIISYICITREGDADSEVNSGPCDTLDRNLGPFFCDVFVALELNFIVDVSDVGDLALKAPALPFDLTLDSPAFAHQGTRRLQQGVESSVLVTNVQEASIEPLEVPV